MFWWRRRGVVVVWFLGPVIPSQLPFVAAVILRCFHRSSSNRSGKSICGGNRKALVINLTNKEPFLVHAPEGGGVEQRKLTVEEVFVDDLDVGDAWTGKATVLFKDVFGCRGRSDEFVFVHHHVVFIIVSYCCVESTKTRRVVLVLIGVHSALCVLFKTFLCLLLLFVFVCYPWCRALC